MTTKRVTYVKLASAKVTGGHSYWREFPSEAMLVADGSMSDTRDPTSTDDGRAEVNAARIREEGLTGDLDHAHFGFRVPLDGRYSTLAALPEAEWLADYFGVPLRVKSGGSTYVLTKEAK